MGNREESRLFHMNRMLVSFLFFARSCLKTLRAIFVAVA